MLTQNIDILLDFYSHKDLSFLNIIINILIHLYLYKCFEELNIDINDYYSLYDHNSESSFVNYIKNKFNFNIYILDEDEYSELKNKLNIEKNIKIDNILEYILKYFPSNKKEIKDNMINNYLVDYIIGLANPKLEKIANLYSGYGNFFINMNKYFKSNNINQPLNNIYGFENNDETRLCSLLNILLTTDKTMDNNILLTDVIHDNIFTDNYDLIISEFPTNVRNIIHAECCNKIKSLKIRGTKSEPLLLQLTMNSLNKQGRCVLVVPDNLLYNESKQHIETRKYLVENFNIKKIVSISSDFQNIKGNKKSILCFEKKGKTEEVTFSKINLKEDRVVEKVLNTIKVNTIKTNYVLFNDKYSNTNEVANNNTNFTKLKDCVDIITDNNDLNILNGNYILVPNYINDNKKIEIYFDDFNLKKDTFTLLVKDTYKDKCLQKYLNYYVHKILQNNILLYTTGKLNKIDFDKLLDFNIKIPSLNTQKTIINYYDLNFKLIDINNEQITRYTKLKSELINLFNDKFDKIKLSSICTIDSKPNNIDTVMVQKNSNLAGKVSLSTEKDVASTNIYFLNNIKTINSKCLYYILKNEENALSKLANLTLTVSLNRTNLENFEIQNFPKEIQEKILTECTTYDNTCKDLIEMNKIIISKNILNEINKLEKNNVVESL